MKKIGGFLGFLALCFLMCAWSNQLQAQSYAIVKIYEPINQAGEIIISYGSGSSETIPVEKLNSEHHEHNCGKLVDVFNRLSKEGYRMVSGAGSGHGNTASILHVDTFVFEKKEE